MDIRNGKMITVKGNIILWKQNSDPIEVKQSKSSKVEDEDSGDGEWYSQELVGEGEDEMVSLSSPEEEVSEISQEEEDSNMEEENHIEIQYLENSDEE
jgi:hypothetical protein